jgi:hypothetical protein
MDLPLFTAVVLAVASFGIPFIVLNGLIARGMWFLGVRGGGMVDAFACTGGVLLSLLLTAALHLLTPLGEVTATVWVF